MGFCGNAASFAARFANSHRTWMRQAGVSRVRAVVYTVGLPYHFISSCFIARYLTHMRMCHTNYRQEVCHIVTTG